MNSPLKAAWAKRLRRMDAEGVSGQYLYSTCATVFPVVIRNLQSSIFNLHPG